jgi:hypothetical protein
MLTSRFRPACLYGGRKASYAWLTRVCKLVGPEVLPVRSPTLTTDAIHSLLPNALAWLQTMSFPCSKKPCAARDHPGFRTTL